MTDVTRKEFEALMARTAELEKALASPTSQHKGLRKKQTIGEFFASKKPENGADKTICMIYANKDVEGNTSSTTSSDLDAKFKHARIKNPPTNISDALAQCARRNLIEQTGKEGRSLKWNITSTGIAYVNNLPK